MTIATFGCCVTVRASGISIECKYEPILYLPDYVRKMSTPPHSFWYITLLHLYTAWFRERGFTQTPLRSLQRFPRVATQQLSIPSVGPLLASLLAAKKLNSLAIKYSYTPENNSCKVGDMLIVVLLTCKSLPLASKLFLPLMYEVFVNSK